MSDELKIREEWRVVGDPRQGFPTYSFTFGDEETARAFVKGTRIRWADGPHIERRTVTETPWKRV